MHIYGYIRKQHNESLIPSQCIDWLFFLHKTYEFISFVWNKMRQTESGEVIGTLCQECEEMQ